MTSEKFVLYLLQNHKSKCHFFGELLLVQLNKICSETSSIFLSCTSITIISYKTR